MSLGTRGIAGRATAVKGVDLFTEELDRLSNKEIEARLATAVWVDEKRAAVLRYLEEKKLGRKEEAQAVAGDSAKRQGCGPSGPSPAKEGRSGRERLRRDQPSRPMPPPLLQQRLSRRLQQLDGFVEFLVGQRQQFLFDLQ